MSNKNPYTEPARVEPGPRITEIERQRNEDQKKPGFSGPNTPLDSRVEIKPGEPRPVPIEHDTPAGQPKP